MYSVKSSGLISAETTLPLALGQAYVLHDSILCCSGTLRDHIWIRSTSTYQYVCHYVPFSSCRYCNKYGSISAIHLSSTLAVYVWRRYSISLYFVCTLQSYTAVQYGTPYPKRLKHRKSKGRCFLYLVRYGL